MERDKKYSNSSDMFEPEKVVGALHAKIPVVTLRGKIVFESIENLLLRIHKMTFHYYADSQTGSLRRKRI